MNEPAAPPSDSPDHRAECYECFRPRSLCYCHLLSPVPNKTPVWIIQHPKERFHPLGTARMAKACLQQAQLLVDWDGSLRSGERPMDFPAGTGLLFPGPDARDLATLPQSDHPTQLVVLDGTWHQARSLYREVTQLHSLPKFSLDSSEPSRYRIRKEPRLECVSTIEAIVRSLRLLEPETPGFDGMLDAFTAMIDRHVVSVDSGLRKPRFRERDRPKRHPLPPFLREDFDRVVIAYGEAAVMGREHARLSRREAKFLDKEIVHWVARRLSDNRTFSAIIKPEAVLAERRRCPMGLSEADIDGGLSMARTRQDWRAFCRPDDLLLTWNKGTLNMLDAMDHEGEAAFLKEPYWALQQRLRLPGGQRGSIDAIMEREGLELTHVEFPGRAGKRLAQLEAITRRVHERGRELSAPRGD